jgi:N-acetylglucosamine-6-phosphate deacetylase
MATYNPARYLGINKRKGSLYPGKDADLVALTPDLDVVMTMVEGEIISGLISLDRE